MISVSQLLDSIDYIKNDLYDSEHCAVELNSDDNIVIFHQYLPDQTWNRFEVKIDDLIKEEKEANAR